MNGEFCFACEYSNEDRINLSGEIRCEKLHKFVNPKHRCKCYMDRGILDLAKKLKGGEQNEII